MAATPKNATLVFQGLTGSIYSRDVYLSDVDGVLATFGKGGPAGASSPTSMRAPEAGFIRDFAFESGMIDTRVLEFLRNGVSTGDFIDKNTHDDGIANRPAMTVFYGAGDEVEAIQHA